MFVYVRDGGEIDQVRETRSNWSSLHDFHYDFRIEIEGRARYIETRLKDESRFQPPVIYVVNMKNVDDRT